MAILTQKSVLLGKIEGTFRTDSDPTTTSSTDNFLVIEPDINADVTVLDRQNSRIHFSPLPGSVGRKIATLTFQHEVRGSGNHVAASGGSVPDLDVLLRACGMSAGTALTASNLLIGPVSGSPAVPINEPTGDVTFAKTGTFAGTLPRVFVIECSLGGISGTATFDIYSPAIGVVGQPGYQAEILTTDEIITKSTPFVLGETASVTPSVWTVDPEVGDTYAFFCTPPGYQYTPISSAFESASFHLYFGLDANGDGNKHIMTGARGTFSCEGTSGNYAMFSFTFTGDYQNPTTAATPTNMVYEATVPPQVELAATAIIGGQDTDTTSAATVHETALCAQNFTFDIGNEVVSRDCINELNGLAGSEIVGRNPTATFNPEIELEGDYPFWGNLSSGDRCAFSLRVGYVPGNIMAFWAPYAQFTGLVYTDRNNIRAYDITMRLATSDTTNGDDEMYLIFC
jgi:hypothetical protein